MIHYVFALGKQNALSHSLFTTTRIQYVRTGFLVENSRTRAVRRFKGSLNIANVEETRFHSVHANL
jgi:hypothetical protein